MKRLIDRRNLLVYAKRWNDVCEIGPYVSVDTLATVDGCICLYGSKDSVYTTLRCVLFYLSFHNLCCFVCIILFF